LIQKVPEEEVFLRNLFSNPYGVKYNGIRIRSFCNQGFSPYTVPDKCYNLGVTTNIVQRSKKVGL